MKKKHTATAGIFLCTLLSVANPAAAEAPSRVPDYETFGKEAAERMEATARSRPSVYTELAGYLVTRLQLAEKPGIGIDIGGGPGDLAVQMAKQTRRLYWINADINTWFLRPFAENALRENVSHRSGFVFADACSLPFKDNYADFVVSRGSYPFWPDLEQGLSEILRVLRSGGEAFIGRGVAPTMPEAEVRRLAEAGQIGGPKYDPDKDAERFRDLMQKLGIRQFEVIRHRAKDPSLNYGVWLYFQKPQPATLP